MGEIQRLFSDWIEEPDSRNILDSLLKEAGSLGLSSDAPKDNDKNTAIIRADMIASEMRTYLENNMPTSHLDLGKVRNVAEGSMMYKKTMDTEDVYTIVDPVDGREAERQQRQFAENFYEKWAPKITVASPRYEKKIYVVRLAQNVKQTNTELGISNPESPVAGCLEYVVMRTVKDYESKFLK